MKKYKTLIRTLHLWLGLSSGVVVVIVGLTGASLVFEEEGRELFQHGYYHVAIPFTMANPGDAATPGDLRASSPLTPQRLPLQQQTDTFKARYPAEKIQSIRFKEAADAATIFFTKTRMVSIDPYTSTITGVRNMNGDFFTVVQKIHTQLYLGEVGKQIIRWNVLIFFLMCISGLVLWWPKQRRFFRQAIRINFKTRNLKRLNWDLHSVLGFYALLVLLIISLTGLFWTFDTAKSLAAMITGGKVPAKEEKVRIKPGRAAATTHPFSIDDAYRYASANYPGANETFVAPATDSTTPIRVLMRYPYTIVRRQNTLFFNPNNGRLLKAELYSAYTAYDKVARSNYDFHTGRIRVLGPGSKIIYFLAALMAASLPITGFMIWLGKRRKKP